MNIQMDVTIFLFHRDFRLEDHRPLQQALDYGYSVLPMFIFTHQQVGDKAPIKSMMSISCMFQGLYELDDHLKDIFKSGMCIMYGDNVESLNKLHKKVNVKAIFETKDYTPFAKQREVEIDEWCSKQAIYFEPIDDLYLLNPGDVTNKSGKMHQKFTFFYEVAKHMEISQPTGMVKGSFINRKKVSSLSEYTLEGMEKTLFKHVSQEENSLIINRFYKGGREEGLTLLKQLPLKYNKTRDIMSEETSGLSVHHHFGTVSIRETFWEAENLIHEGHSGLKEFQRQLFWRDFYGHLMYFFEDLYKVDPIEFQKDWKVSKEKEKLFENWCNGTTDEPLINASMNQLNESGYMHNRNRTLVANWLVKTGGVPWRLGERYFASKLLDYDISQNMLNWCFVTSPGLPFTEPPFRVYNPDRYQKNFDPDHKYLDEWS